ncbi:hypothetical protein JCM6882_009129, partial [Rhodosporidiobolus microsporus]
FASSFSSASSSAASIRSHCSSTLEADDSIFLTAVQRNIAAFARLDKPSSAPARPSPSFSSPSVLLRAAAWEHRAAAHFSEAAGLPVRPEWRY